MSKTEIDELINRSEVIKNCFQPSSLLPGANVLSGNDFQKWLADILSVVSQLQSKPLTEKILALSDSFDGWNDEKSFSEIIGCLKSLSEHYTDYSLEKGSSELNSDQVKENSVFVVYGRNKQIKEAMFIFLRAIGVYPLEWNEIKNFTGKASPYVGEILNTGFSKAQAIIVLFTPDDDAKLKDVFLLSDDGDDERNITAQPRQNVLLEAGMALGMKESRTIIIEFGKLRKISDLEGRHVIRFHEDNPQFRNDIIDHLQTAEVKFSTDGKSDWLTVGDFSN
jgi:predicted nucleotide-binding protein